MATSRAHRQEVAKATVRAFSGEVAEPGLWPSEIATLYGVPAGRDGAGQCVAVVSLGGGYIPNDVLEATRSMGLPMPLIVDSPQSGVANSFGVTIDADKEIALDLQVLAGIVPAARIVVYFAINSHQGLADAIAAAVSDEVNRPSALSVSWGSAERFWPQPVRDSLEAALAEAAQRKVTVVAASGDLLATGGLDDGTANVMYPGSSPSVLGCGGSRLTLDSSGAQIESEVAWNDGRTGTGGGISSVFGVPAYQTGMSLPNSFTNGVRGRGVPDVAAAAASRPGYRIVFDGHTIVKDGTSAAAPLWAALVTLANAERGRPVGFVNERLYRNPQVCRDIAQGSNRLDGVGYDATVGWDACTGLGSPWAAAVIESLVVME